MPGIGGQMSVSTSLPWREGSREGERRNSCKCAAESVEKEGFKTVMKWFEVVPSDAVFEMGKGPIRVEDF